MGLPVHPLSGLQRQEDILDLVDTAIIRLDAGGKVQSMNAAAEYCLRLGRERAQGSPLSEIFHLPAEIHDALAQPQQSGASVRLHELQLPGGEYDCTVHTDERGQALLELHDLE